MNLEREFSPGRESIGPSDKPSEVEKPENGEQDKKEKWWKETRPTESEVLEQEKTLEQRIEDVEERAKKRMADLQLCGEHLVAALAEHEEGKANHMATALHYLERHLPYEARTSGGHWRPQRGDDDKLIESWLTDRNWGMSFYPEDYDALKSYLEKVDEIQKERQEELLKLQKSR